MNRIYRVVYNARTRTCQAVSEHGKGRHKTHSESNGQAENGTSVSAMRNGVPFLPSALAAVLAVFVPFAHAAPVGGEVVRGQAAISQQGKLTDIHQTTPKAAINWQQFGIKADETVRFRQPGADSVTLNRVTGRERSLIDGTLTANGHVFIANPNGMLIGKGAKINVGSLLATGADISNDDFMLGKYRFHNGAGAIANFGNITVPEGGTVALIAPIVNNQGTINAPQGTALLASADSFVVKFAPDGLGYTVTKGTLQGLVDNGGAVLADGGRIVLTAKGTDSIKKSLIKHSGIAQANTVQNKNGVIELLGDLDNSRLEVSGSLKAEAPNGGDGGFVETSAAEVKIADTAKVSTQSAQGNTGTWLIDPNDFIVSPAGGDITGQQVSAALQKNNLTLKSRDGSQSGIGEVIIDDAVQWDKNTLTLHADDDIHIRKIMHGKGTAKLALEYGQKSDDSRGFYFLEQEGKIYLPEGNNLSIKNGKQTQPAVFNVLHRLPEIEGNESVLSGENIAFGKDMDLSDTANHKGFNGWELSDTPWVNIHGLGHRLSNLTLRPSSSRAGLIRHADNVHIHGVHLDNVNIQSNHNHVGGLSGVARNAIITQSSASGVVKGEYFVGGLIGEVNDSEIKDSSSHGTVEGDDKLGGLIAYSHNSNISKSHSTVNVTGDWWVGGLVGVMNGGSIVKSHTSGNVNGHQQVGGLVGGQQNERNRSDADSSLISRSHTTGNVLGNEEVGGLIGNSDMTKVEHAYSTGNVSAQAMAGGLIGNADRTQIEHSYTTGHVTPSRANVGGRAFGGLIGASEFTDVKASHAVGNVLGSEDIGGLIGDARNTNITNSYGSWEQRIEAVVNEAGGLVGSAVGVNIADSYAAGQVSGGAWLGGLVGSLGHGRKRDGNSNHTSPTTSIRNSFAVGRVANKNNSGGLVGGDVGALYEQPNILSVTDSYFDIDATGQTETHGNKGEGKSTAEMKQKSTFQNWDFDNVWRISEGQDYPRLRKLTEGEITVNGHKLLLKGVAISKTYNGQPIITVDELVSLQGWKDGGIIPIGLKAGDSLSDASIFSGKLVLGGTWQGAVNAGTYTIVPSGLSSQKYAIKFENGTLTIHPIALGLSGTRPYNGSSRVVVDKNTKITGDILPNDQGKLTVSGSSEIVKELPGRFEPAKDVGNYRLLGGNLTVSNKNYVINPAISSWKITPKTIYLTGRSDKGAKTVNASYVNLSQLGIEAVDKGMVGLTGQGVLDSNNKLARNHSFKLTGSKAGNYVLNTNRAWTVSSDSGSTNNVTPPNNGSSAGNTTSPSKPDTTAQDKRQFDKARDAVNAVWKIVAAANEQLAEAKRQNRHFASGKWNEDIIAAKAVAVKELEKLSAKYDADKARWQAELGNVRVVSSFTPSTSAATGGTNHSANGSSAGNTTSNTTSPSKPDTSAQDRQQFEKARAAVSSVEAVKLLANNFSNDKSRGSSDKIKSIKLNLDNSPWDDYMRQNDELYNFKKGAIVLSEKEVGFDAQKALNNILQYRKDILDIDEQVKAYIKNISNESELQGGAGSVVLKEYIESVLRYNLTVNSYNEYYDDYLRIEKYFSSVSDKESLGKINRNLQFLEDIEGKIDKNRENNAKKWKLSRLGNIFMDELVDSSLMLFVDAPKGGYAASKYVIPGLYKFNKVIGKIKDKIDYITVYKGIHNYQQIEDVKLAIEGLLDIPSDLQEFLAMDDSRGIENVDFALRKLSKYKKLLSFSDGVGKGVDVMENLSKVYLSVSKSIDFYRSVVAITRIPDNLLSVKDKERLIKYFKGVATLEFVNTVEGVLNIIASLASSDDLLKPLSDLKSDISDIVGGFVNIRNREMAKNMRYVKLKLDQEQVNIKNLNFFKASIMRDILIGVGKSEK